MPFCEPCPTICSTCKAGEIIRNGIRAECDACGDLYGYYGDCRCGAKDVVLAFGVCIPCAQRGEVDRDNWKD